MYAVIALIGLMLLTWGAAVWASFAEEPNGVEHGARSRLRRAA